ncbi:MAG: alpha/beta hydrolase [Hyphomicrobiales bacterium]|nr:MAG: alpha/beta hydrolase [Hyphomicrobiales bacterium]
MRWFGRLLFVAVAVYAALLAMLYLRQRDLVFPRDATRAEVAQTGLAGAQEVTLTAADGERLVAWVVPPRAGKPVILYFHGNAGNLGRPGRVGRFRALTEDGTGLLAVSYRGYGGSTGSPSEEGLHLDARAAYGAAAERFGAAQLVGYGESLGTGVVLKLAAEVPLAAVILEAPYLSTVAVAQGVYPYVPVRLLMLDPFRSDTVIGRVGVPLLVLHGARDGVIPFAQGEALYGLANPPKRFLRFPQGGHEDLPAHGSMPEIRLFLADVARGGLTGAESRTVE